MEENDNNSVKNLRELDHQDIRSTILENEEN